MHTSFCRLLNQARVCCINELLNSAKCEVISLHNGSASQPGSVTQCFCKPKTAAPEQQFKTNISGFLAKGFQKLDNGEGRIGNQEFLKVLADCCWVHLRNLGLKTVQWILLEQLLSRKPCKINVQKGSGGPIRGW